MRTLSRPMFNMGGPIKQGIMNGIREPHKDGNIVGGHQSPLLAGAHPIKDASGREHHLVPAIAAWTGIRAALPWAMRAGARYLKPLFGSTTPASVTRGAKVGKNAWKKLAKTDPKIGGPFQNVTMNPAKFNPNWLGRDPLVRTVGAAGKAIFNPTVGGWAGSAARFATSPSSLAIGGLWYANGKWFNKKGEEVDPPEGINKPGGFPGADTGTGGGATGMTSTQQKAFAKSQRDARVTKYLDMMGYDRAKKTAIADALIDASKIVGERGTLDKKNITQELINPIIQATSKRLDKPEQIREAVGLMMTKAGLEKEMYDAKPGNMMKNIQDLVASGMSEEEAKTIVLKQSKGVGSDIMGFMASQKGKVKAEQLESIARLSAHDHKTPFKKITDEEVAAIPALEGKTALEIVSTQETDGVYMVGDIVFEIKGGKPTQLTFG